MDGYSLDDNLFKVVEKQEFAIRDFGFPWEHAGQIIEQIRGECKEVEEALQEVDKAHLQEEVGDLMQAAITLAVFCGLDPQETLLASIHKFQKRFDLIVALAKQDGHETLHGQPFDVLMSYWNRAKEG